MTLHDVTMTAGTAGPSEAAPAHPCGFTARTLRASFLLLRALVRHLCRGARMEQAGEQLYSLPDQLLHDIGLRRSEILYMTRFGRDPSRNRRELES